MNDQDVMPPNDFSYGNNGRVIAAPSVAAAPLLQLPELPDVAQPQPEPPQQDDSEENNPPPAKRHAPNPNNEQQADDADAVAEGANVDAAAAQNQNPNNEYQPGAAIGAAMGALFGDADVNAPAEEFDEQMADRESTLARSIGFIGHVIVEPCTKPTTSLSLVSYKFHFYDVDGKRTSFYRSSTHHGDKYVRDALDYAVVNGYSATGWYNFNLRPLVNPEHVQNATDAGFPPGEVALIEIEDESLGRTYTRLLHLITGCYREDCHVRDFCRVNDYNLDDLNLVSILKQRILAGGLGFEFSGDNACLAKSEPSGKVRIMTPDSLYDMSPKVNFFDKSPKELYEEARINQSQLLCEAVNELKDIRQGAPSLLREWENYSPGESVKANTVSRWANKQRYPKYLAGKRMTKFFFHTITIEEYDKYPGLTGRMLCIIQRYAVGDLPPMAGLMELLNPAFIVCPEDEDDVDATVLCYSREIVPDELSVDENGVGYTIVEEDTILFVRANSLTNASAEKVFDETATMDEDFVITRFNGIRDENGELLVVVSESPAEEWLVRPGEGESLSDVVDNNIFVAKSPGNELPVFYDETQELQDLKIRLQHAEAVVEGGV